MNLYCETASNREGERVLVRVVKLLVLILIPLLICSLPCWANQDLPSQYPFERIPDCKWGFIDSTGKFQIEAKFDVAYSFSEGMCVVGNTLGGRNGYLQYFLIDNLGNRTSPNFGFLSSRKQGMLVAAQSEDFSYPTRGPLKGLHLLSVDFSRVSEKFDVLYQAGPFFGFRVNEGLGLLDLTGKTFVRSSPELAQYVAPGRLLYRSKSNIFSLRDFNGDLIAEFDKDVADVKYANGIFILNAGKGNFRIADFNGSLITNVQADYLRCFSEGLACIERGGLWGAIDITGKLQIPVKFAILDDFSEGVAVAKLTDGGGFGYLSTTGNWAINPTFESAEAFSGGFAIVRRKDKEAEWTFIRHDGERLFAPKFKFRRLQPFNEGLAAACICDIKKRR